MEELIPQPVLETERLILRAPTLDDAADVHEIHRHEEVAAGVLSIPHPCPPGYAAERIAEQIESNAAGKSFLWMIELRETGHVIGDLGISLNTKHRRGYIGYLLHPEFWGRGLITEAVGAMMRWAFVDLDSPMNRIEADFFPGNEGSRRVCEKLGMTVEGTLRQHILKEGEYLDCIHMAMLRDEFLKLQGGLP